MLNLGIVSLLSWLLLWQDFFDDPLSHLVGLIVLDMMAAARDEMEVVFLVALKALLSRLVLLHLNKLLTRALVTKQLRPVVVAEADACRYREG